MIFFLRFTLFYFIFRQRGREGETERNNVWLPLMHPLLGTWPTTQARVLTGNRTSDLLVRRLALNPLSNTSQGYKREWILVFLFLHEAVQTQYEWTCLSRLAIVWSGSCPHCELAGEAPSKDGKQGWQAGRQRLNHRRLVSWTNQTVRTTRLFRPILGATLWEWHRHAERC